MESEEMCYHSLFSITPDVLANYISGMTEKGKELYNIICPDYIYIGNKKTNY